MPPGLEAEPPALATGGGQSTLARADRRVRAAVRLRRGAGAPGGAVGGRAHPGPHRPGETAGPAALHHPSAAQLPGRAERAGRAAGQPAPVHRLCEHSRRAAPDQAEPAARGGHRRGAHPTDSSGQQGSLRSTTTGAGATGRYGTDPDTTIICPTPRLPLSERGVTLVRRLFPGRDSYRNLTSLWAFSHRWTAEW